MARLSKTQMANLPPGADNPLNAAIMSRDNETLAMVTQAVAHKDAHLAFQPAVQARAQTSVAFYEGLIRLHDETGRVIPAKDFVPVIEDTEIGREIDLLSLNKGCRALSAVSRLRLSINMSARSIGYVPYMRALERWLKKDDTIGPRLILEITEGSAMMVPELVIDFMDRLQPRGICFALDDFGAGFTAFRYFKDFFFDVVKIDGQFIRGISKDPDNLLLTKAMVGLAQQFDMMTVASTVESPEDAQILTQMGVDCLQGYHFGAPVTKPSWLTKRYKQSA